MYNEIVHQTGSFVPAGNGLMRYESGLDFNKDELIDFKSYIEQKQKELAENPPQNPFGDDIPVADFSKFREYLSGKELSAADPIQALEAATGRKISTDARYSVTDEEAEYFREKYGEEYDEETVADFFYELAEKGIISHLDASNATCSGFIIKVPPEEQPGKWAGTHMTHTVRYRLNDIKYMRSRNIFAEEYKDFKRDYDKGVITWEDFIQEQRDFYEYMRNRDTIYDAEGNQRQNNPLVGYDKRLEGLERAADIIKRIFG